ncbi:hypothetical protein [Novosphingobium sp.]|uniref:hypothetical protein n=1 Tax=Novosphingobium sp. TaxID=1874826 RepID=UPI0027346394|nr:hypothetical protein [Novosphingobium sp.]MDP3908593.1 hypothetical protein [Novosphingobium sp.]
MDDGNLNAERSRSGFGMTLGLIVLAIAALVGILFFTGFWTADIKGGSMPTVDVSAEEGSLPTVDMQSKEIVVGTTTKTVEVPKVETKQVEVTVPVVGVKNNNPE